VHSLLVDSPAAPRSEQSPAGDGQVGQPSPSPDSGSTSAAAGPTCANCDAPLQEGQQWCLHCGAGQPDSLGTRFSWRPLSTLTLLAVLLVAGAAVAGAAALNSHQSAPRAPLTVAQAPAAATPSATTPGTATTPTTPAVPGATPTPTKVPHIGKATGTPANNPLFPSTSKPPKIPSTTSTPKSTGAGEGTSTTGVEKKPSEKATTTTESKPQNGAEGNAEQSSAILLDTDAASTYNPYKYPESGFGDPALAIDGEGSTAWTAQVQPSSAPRMAEGLLINLNSPTKLGAVKLVTTTPGMTVQIYGANGKPAPAAITEPGWTPLSASHELKKKSTRLKLRSASQAFRFVVVWIVRAPASAVGTAQAPGHVSLNEVELFPPAS
jgi:hypothetical protein